MRISTTVLFLAIVLVTIGMLGTIVPFFAKPAGRIYTGMHGYSSDYVQYVSYIKEGMYGQYTMLWRSFPFPQPETPIHFLYIALGIMAKFSELDAPTVYHIARALFGVVYVVLVYLLLRTVLSHGQALLATIIGFVAGPFPGLSFFSFSQIISEQVTNRPHYLAGAVLFVTLAIRFLKDPIAKSTWDRLLVIIVSALVVMIQSPFGILLLLVSALAFLLWRKNIFVFTAIGCLAGIGIIYWSVGQYTAVPEVWFSFYFYAVPITPMTILKDLVSFGPVLWLSMFFVLKKHTWVDNFFLIWLFVQLGLYLFGYQFFKMDRVRFVQSLYFIPMAYGAVRLINKPLLLGVLILISLPFYLSSIGKSLYDFTDYKTFSVFAFPTTAQREAFRFLDEHTPRHSIVFAFYEASNLILIYSHNFTLGNDQGWGTRAEGMKAERDLFLTGTMPETQALAYLKKYNVSYVYYGYQERYRGNVIQYSFLKSIFDNGEVLIYEVSGSDI